MQRKGNPSVASERLSVEVSVTEKPVCELVSNAFWKESCLPTSIYLKMNYVNLHEGLNCCLKKKKL